MASRGYFMYPGGMEKVVARPSVRFGRQWFSCDISRRMKRWIVRLRWSTWREGACYVGYVTRWTRCYEQRMPASSTNREIPFRG